MAAACVRSLPLSSRTRARHAARPENEAPPGGGARIWPTSHSHYCLASVPPADSIIPEMADTKMPAEPAARNTSTMTRVMSNTGACKDEAMICERCGKAEMYRMHAVWRCPECGFKTDCCGW